MSKRSFNPQECIGPLNTVKQGMQMAGRPFSKESILNGLKGCGLPTNATFWSVFRKAGILQEVSKGQFMFMSKDPIFVGTLSKIQADYQKLARRYNQHKESQKPEKVETEKTNDQENSPENDPLAMTQFAIDLLKEQGYLIFAPSRIEYTQV